MLRRWMWALTLICVALPGCPEPGGGVDPKAPPVVRFKLALEEGDGFFAQPFPGDIRLTAEGRIDLSGFSGGSVLVERMLDTTAAESAGFAMGGAIFFRFSAEVKPTSLPSPGLETLDASAAVFLVDVDPDSPDYGQRVPLWVKFEAGASGYIGDNWLGLLPFPGHPLREGTTYAAVVTDRVQSVDDEAFGRDEDFARIMDGAEAGEDAALAAAQSTFEPLSAWLADAGIDPATVVGGTVFTTQVVTTLVEHARTVVRALAEPSLQDVTLLDDNPSDYRLFAGTYEAPIFQEGEAPYRQSGGRIVVDAAGAPVLDHMETLRIAISVPNATDMPAAGWPVVIYRHGTGGDYRGFAANGTAGRLAKPIDQSFNLIGRMAVVSIDGVVHGPRGGDGGGTPEELFYNFTNPLAGRDNSRQEAIDNFQLVRLVKTIDVTDASGTGVDFHFDPERIYYFGHSQGAITGSLFVPFEPDVKAALLSGAGAHLLLTLQYPVSGFDIPTVLSLALNDAAYGPIDEFHPALTMVQTYIETADTLAYLRRYLKDPPAGMGPRNVMLTYGLGDSSTPNITTETFASAAGLAPAGEALVSYPSMELRGEVSFLAEPVCGNYSSGDATSTAVVVQYRPSGNNDGHFVVFDHVTAKRQSAAFLATHAYRGCATLVP